MDHIVLALLNHYIDDVKGDEMVETVEAMNAMGINAISDLEEFLDENYNFWGFSRSREVYQCLSAVMNDLSKENYPIYANVTLSSNHIIEIRCTFYKYPELVVLNRTVKPWENTTIALMYDLVCKIVSDIRAVKKLYLAGRLRKVS